MVMWWTGEQCVVCYPSERMVVEIEVLVYCEESASKRERVLRTEGENAEWRRGSRIFETAAKMERKARTKSTRYKHW